MSNLAADARVAALRDRAYAIEYALEAAPALIASGGSAEARGHRGGAIAAGVIGGLALGAIAAQAAEPRTVYVVERRTVRSTAAAASIIIVTIERQPGNSLAAPLRLLLGGGLARV